MHINERVSERVKFIGIYTHTHIYIYTNGKYITERKAKRKEQITLLTE